MKSIKTKLLLLTTILTTVIITGVSVLAIVVSSNALDNTSEVMLKALVQQSSKLVESKVNEQLSIVKLIASRKEIVDTSLSTEQKLVELSQLVDEYKFSKLGIADLNGNIIFTDQTNTQISEREYYQTALKGTANVSDPLMSKVDNKMVVIYAVPIIENGSVLGVLTATRDSNEISNIVTEISYGKTGKACMINKEGTKIAHPNNDLVIKMDNDIENAKTNPELEQIAAIEQEMIQGKTGVGEYSMSGVDKKLAYAPVNGTGWSLSVIVERNEVMSELTVLIRVIIIAAIIFLIVACMFVYWIANGITKKIRFAIGYLVEMSKGDFTHMVPVKDLRLKDEVGQMLNAVNTTQQSIKDMLQIVMDNSTKIDTDAQSLSAVSQQMSASSSVVTNAIQEVAKGSVSQVTSITSIAEGLNRFSGNIEQIANDIKNVDQNAKDIMELSEDSNHKMRNLAESVKNTNQTFGKFETGIQQLGENIGKINEITKIINDISDQTNLLSLNASIEAARAGEAGRGFAVVADEIRALAEQSKASSVNIANLINTIYSENNEMVATTNSVSKEFKEQTEVINVTLASFNQIVDSVKAIIPKIVNVNASTEMITKEKNEILSSVEDISAISQEASASTEEISASAEEMASSTEDVANSASNLSTSTSEMIQEIQKFKL